MKIMLLPSVDGPEYALAVIVPEGMTDETAQQEVRAAIDKVIAADPNEWNWADVEPHLHAKGFQTPELVEGPTWDE